jgi:hypothetical protein
LDEKFTFTITKDGKTAPVTEYFKIQEPKLEKWNFTWYEGKQLQTYQKNDFSTATDRL